MKVKIQKWGKNLAIRIPKRLIRELKLDENSIVELSINAGKLEIRLQNAITLDTLLAGWDERTVDSHGETDYGAPMGNEAW